MSYRAFKLPFLILLFVFSAVVAAQPQWQVPADANSATNRDMEQQACGSALTTSWKYSATQLFNTCKSCGHSNTMCETTVTNWCHNKACQKFTGCLDRPEFGCSKVQVVNPQEPLGGAGSANSLGSNVNTPKNQPISGDRSGTTRDSASRNSSPGDKGSRGSSTPSKVGAEPIKTPGASGDASQDQQVCAQLQRRANQCCNNPESCGGSSGRNSQGALESAIAHARSEGRSDQEGIREYCEQTQSTGELGSAYNASMGNACYEAYSSCQASCEDMARTYGGSQAADFRSRAQQCAGLRDKMSLMGQQGLGMAQSGMSGDVCSQMSQAQGQSAPGGGMGGGGPGGGGPGGGAGNGMGGDQGMNSPYNNAMNPNDPFNCQIDPSHPACRSQNQGESQTARNEFSGLEQNAADKTFDLPGAGGSSADSFSSASEYVANSKGGAQNGTIPNNSGGSIPGAGSSSSATLDSPRPKSGGGAGGVNTDIDRGFLSGGGGGGGGAIAANSSGSGADDDFDGDFGARNPSGAEKDLKGLDLKKFLPGGSLGPGPRFGGLNSNRSQINGANVNLFERITSRLQEKCRLGLLFDCRR